MKTGLVHHITPKLQRKRGPATPLSTAANIVGLIEGDKRREDSRRRGAAMMLTV